MKKVLVIVGPTAIGKTSLSIKLAQKYNGEIISGDSIQVYKGLDIGSGKITDAEKQNIIHHGIDILDADESFSVADFQKNCRSYIDNIVSKNKLAIICGGTGLYIKAALYDYVFNEQEVFDYSEYESLSNEYMYDQLKILDLKSLDKIHVNNRQRLIRAYALALNDTTKSSIIDKQEHKPIYDIYIVGLTTDRAIVHDRINTRVDMMFDDGLNDEITKLLDSGITFSNQSMQGIGYKEFGLYNDIDIIKDKIKTNSRRFAKKQYTWFKNQMNVNWFDINKLDDVFIEVDKWINT